MNMSTDTPIWGVKLFEVCKPGIRGTQRSDKIVCLVMNMSLLKRLSNHFRPKGQSVQAPEADKSDFKSHEYTYRDDLPVVIMAKGIYQALLDKGLEDFILSDFTNTTILTREDLRNRTTREARIQQITSEILQYLRLPPFIALNISYDQDNNTVSHNGKTSTRVGEYSNTAQKRTITLNIGSGFTPENVLAILCHECTHCFMETHLLNWEDTDLNEQRTDVMANLIGFNSIMTAGYAGVSVITGEHQERLVNYQNISNRRIGYISEDDCRILKELLSDLTSQAQQAREAQIELKERKDTLNRQIAAASVLEQQLSALNIKFTNITDSDNLIGVQKCLCEYESRDIKAEINQFKAISESNDLSLIDQATQRIDALCVDMLRWCTVFQG